MGNVGFADDATVTLSAIYTIEFDNTANFLYERMYKVQLLQGFCRTRYQNSIEMRLIVLITLFILVSLTGFASVTAHFACSEVKGCSPLVVNLTDSSSGHIINRVWDFGNGNTSTLLNPSANYVTPGNYTIKLTVSDGTNTSIYTQVITVFTPPTVNFTSDNTSACPGDSVRFVNLVTPGSAPISRYAWGFGNGIANSDTNAVYVYNRPGSYSVTLVAQDSNGCDGNMTQVNYITVWHKPTAAYIASPYSSCGTSQYVDFTNQSVGNSLVSIWKFGDDSTSISTDASHLYTYGKYKSRLVVTDNNGCADSVDHNIAVIHLIANFAASDTQVCAGQQIGFADLSPMSGSSWHWDFGDGTTSNKQNPTKVYTQPGVYSVSFTVNDDVCGDSSTKINYITVTPGFQLGFNATARQSCTTPFAVTFTSQAPSGVSLVWNFGDGNTSTDTTPTNLYTTPSNFSVTLTATDSSGCVVIANSIGYINTSKPGVKFFCDTLVCPGTRAHYYNQTTNATSYLWNFGDGDTSTQVNPSHVYNAYGRYTISLTAWDSLGCDSTLIMPALINSDSVQIGFQVDTKFSMCPPLVSIFNSTANRDDLSYYWDFGDGYNDTAANPTHIFFHPGVFTVKLTATSKFGCTTTVVDSNLIVVQGPSGIFTVTPTSGCMPLNVKFTAATSSNTLSAVCDLGDGTLYTDSLSFSYTYTSARTFYPNFILTDHIGCSVPYALDSIVVHPLPSISSFKDTSVCAGQTVVIPLQNDHYIWSNRSVNQCDTCLSPLSVCPTCNALTLQPADTTIYMVTATSQFGCQTSTQFKIMVDALPVLKPIDTIKLCKNISVPLNAVEQAYGVTWSPATYLNSNTDFEPTTTPAEDITYIVTAYNRLGCVATESVPVRVYTMLPLSISNDTSVCAGSSVQLNAYVSDTFFHNVTYTWSHSPYLNNLDISDPMATIQSESETFQVSATSGSCPSATASVTINVNPAATVQLPATIITNPNAEVSISPIAGNLTTFNWSAKNELSCTECSTTTLVPTESQIVYLEGKNQYGCMTKDSIQIHLISCDPGSLFVPNTFTPNGDGVNDKLYVRSKTLAQLDYFRVFNRWGAIVYETRNISEGWDGTINGKLADDGVYVYQVSGKCESGYDVATNGSVTLIR